jgi:hypothetical protein
MKLQTPAQLMADSLNRRMKQAATRVNVKEPTHTIISKSDLAPTMLSKHYLNRTSMVTPKPEGTALPPTHNTLKDPGTYNGAELRPFDGRPGAMDAFKLPSKGL